MHKLWYVLSQREGTKSLTLGNKNTDRGMQNRTKRIFLSIIVIFATALVSMAQEKQGYYYITYPASEGGVSISGKSIKHRAAKWYQGNIVSQRSSDDDFDTGNQMVTLESGAQIQATNTYVDTIYMRKGTYITLMIPNQYDDNQWQVSINNYYRWFNYRNDKSFYIGDIGMDNSTIWPQDLLTNVNWPLAWRFENGYVAGLLNYNTGSMDDLSGDAVSNSLRQQTFYYPTDDEYSLITNGAGASNFEGLDNDYYVVACDLSNYTDFSDGTYVPGTASTFGAGGDYCEPTLSGRVIFYIVGIDELTTASDLPTQFQQYGKLFSDTHYQGGTNEEGKKYLEEYEITYPCQRVSGNPNDNEALTLSKEAQGYALPGESGDEVLDVQFASGEDNGLTLTEPTGTLSGSSITLSGTGRVIQFHGNISDVWNNQWSVDDGSTATILVTKTVNHTIYNIARYKLKFKKENIPLTEAQVAALDESYDERTLSYIWWSDLTERAPSYLESCELVASLDFDYSNSGYDDSDVNSSKVFGSAHGERFNYPFPLGWGSNGFAFYDGSFDVNPFTDTTVSPLGLYSYHTQRMLYNTYGIVNYYVGNLEVKESIIPWEPTCKKVKNHTGNWLYINPTDKPSEIAEISFEKGDLRGGTKLLVSAWLRNANALRTNYDASVMFTLIGVKADGTEDAIYMSNSGQIEITDGSVYILNESDAEYLVPGITGKGSGTNEWYQIFFSYVLKDEDISKYDYYTVRVNNSCSRTQGGGYYFDELKVYKKELECETSIVQLEPVTPMQYTSIRAEFSDYEALMYNNGLDTDVYSSSSTSSTDLDFIIINENTYNDYISTNGTSTISKKAAISNSIVNVSYEDASGNTVTTQNPGAKFYCYYENNAEYSEGAAGSNYPSDGYLYRRVVDSTGVKQLVADYTADVSANVSYRIILNTSGGTDATSVNGTTITDAQLTVFANLIGASNSVENTFIPYTIEYETEYRDDNTEEISIIHRPAKWYQMRESGREYDDTFDDENEMYTINGIAIQATHTYVDTIYMHKGSTIGILSPNTLVQTYDDGSQLWMSATPNYYRWFDYRTDGTFYFNPDNGYKDLLTPDATKESDNELTAWRFKNGYVSGGAMDGGSKLFVDMYFYYPTDAEFTAAKASNSKCTLQDNKYYLVACDLSAYTDFAEKYEDGGTPFGYTDSSTGQAVYCEPTLSGRLLFYIIGVDDVADSKDADSDWRKNGYGRVLNDAYQGGGNANGSKYLEEYDFTYPSHRLSNYTNELVTLSKDADAYAIPDVSYDDDVQTVTATVASNDNSAGIEIVSETLDGTNRVIQFRKQGATDAEPWEVEDKSTATIIVTKTVNGTTYNIARYKLTFREDVTPLTQHQVASIGSAQYDNADNSWWNSMKYRTPEYMNENLELITSLEFNYTESGDVNDNIFDGVGGRKYYKFPLEWDECTYAFYDGSNTEEGNFADDASVVRWCEYAIMEGYYGNGENYGDLPAVTQNMAKEEDNFFLYVDASDRPGTIATLPFEEDLCQGSEIFVTAWMKSSGTEEADDAGVLFTIVGVDEESGEEEIIYQHCSGQIRTTCYIDEAYPGMGENTNDWFQIYFSFICSDVNYDSYSLKIENYCASTAGGDFYLDEVKVYVQKPTVGVMEINPTCENEKSLVRMDLNYEVMLSRLGLKEYDYEQGGGETASVDFIIINKDKYDEYLTEYEGDATSVEAITAAIANSIATEEGEDASTMFPTMDFYLYYEDNAEYEEGGTNLGEESEWYFRRATDEFSNRLLSIDFYSNLDPFVNYLIIIEPHTGTFDATAKEREFAQIINTGCTIESEFYVTSATLLRLNGELVIPSDIENLCVGEIINVSPQARYQDEDGEYQTIDYDVYYDWFFGDLELFKEENSNYGGESVYTALTAFREVYPDVWELESSWNYYSNDTSNKDDYGNYIFTENQYNLLNYYVNQSAWEGSESNMLVLRQKSLNVKIIEGEQKLVCMPIQNDDATPGDAVMVCLSYIELSFVPTGLAPSLGVGFSNVSYPADDFVPNVRLGLSQLTSATNSNPITVNLRQAQYVDPEDNDNSDTTPDHLGVVSSSEGDVDMTSLFLVASDDPAYISIFGDSFSMYDLPVGTVKYLYAKEDEVSDSEGIGAYMQIYFNTGTFTPKEGCYYTMTTYFEEKDASGNSIPTSCYGSFPLEIKVVPEYLVWEGTSTGNWNDDENWRRADAEEINKTSGYTTNEGNGVSTGLVPMLFSKVVMPKDSRGQLYMAGYAESDGTYSWSGEDSKPTELSSPTRNIMYDMMIYTSGSSMKTERYRVNVCDEIHFEPGAELLHSERLLYNKAWVDVSVPQSTWSLVSLPLKDVVAGDWYITGQNSTETSEYFTEINFSGSTSRYNPMVYQRSWNSSSSVIVGSANSSNNSSSSNKTVPSYSSTGWSSVYNDASVAYGVGDGFSVKAYVERGSSSGSSLVFRFPKADTRYDYSSSTGTISRTGAGELKVSDWTDRSSVDVDAGNIYTSSSITVSVGETAEGYSLVGNPFPSSLSLSQFLKGNSNISSYWLESEYGPIAGTEAGSSWGTEDALLPPCGAFFVQAKTYNANGMDLTFTSDMQVLSDETETASVQTMSIRAASAEGMSSAAFTYSEDAEDGYSENEDAVMLEDASWNKSGMPMVYTVAGSMAVSVNTLKELRVIPLGVFANEGSSYTLTFVGVDNIDEPTLYDAELNTETPITEGMVMTLEGATHGRYFIHTSGAATGINEVIEQNASVSVYSPTSRTIVVSAESEIETVEVYSINGGLLKRATVNGSACTITDVDCGIAVVKVETADGSHVSKLRIKN